MKMKQKKKLLESLKTIKDFRVHKGKIIYPLYEVLFMTLFGLLKGNVTFEQLHDWMEFNTENRIFLKLFNKGKIDIPSESTLHRILINTDNNALEKVFRKYFREFANLENIAIDGKFLNGSDVNGQYTKQSHKSVLNILDKDIKIVVGHKMIEDKKSEIPAFREELASGDFSSDGQIFSFDALQTQYETLNNIDKLGNKYIAKVKGNQETLKEKLIETIESFKEPTDIYEDEEYTREGNKEVLRKVEIFQSESCNIVVFDKNFNNIQTIIKVTKTIVDLKIQNSKKIKSEYLIANFKTVAKEYKEMILQHWLVETYHYHLDMLTKEDEHIGYINPFSMSILRSFTINLYQLFMNKYKGEKIVVERVQTKKPLTMARTKRYCKESDIFVSEIFEK